MTSSTPSVLRVRGCDDSTDVSLESFTEEEIAAIRKLQALVNKIGGGCMPTIHFGRMTTELNVVQKPYEFFKDEDDE